MIRYLSSLVAPSWLVTWVFGEPRVARFKTSNAGRPNFPVRTSAKSGAYDIYLPNSITVAPGATARINAEFRTEFLSEGYCALVMPKHNVYAEHTILVHPVTIQPDYNGDVSILFTNESENRLKIEAGSSLAQIMFVPYGRAYAPEAEEVNKTLRPMFSPDVRIVPDE